MKLEFCHTALYISTLFNGKCEYMDLYTSIMYYTKVAYTFIIYFIYFKIRAGVAQSV